MPDRDRHRLRGSDGTDYGILEPPPRVVDEFNFNWKEWLNREFTYLGNMNQLIGDEATRTALVYDSGVLTSATANLSITNDFDFQQGQGLLIRGRLVNGYAGNADYYWSINNESSGYRMTGFWGDTDTANVSVSAYAPSIIAWGFNTGTCQFEMFLYWDEAAGSLTYQSTYNGYIPATAKTRAAQFHGFRDNTYTGSISTLNIKAYPSTPIGIGSQIKIWRFYG